MTSLDPYFGKYGNEFGVSPGKLSNVARLESGYDVNAMNDWDSNAAAGTPSGGPMQFIQPTFNSFYDQASAARPDLFNQMGQKEWMNPEQQVATAAWAFSQGLGDHWTTYDRAGDQAGASTSSASTPTRANRGRTDEDEGRGRSLSATERKYAGREHLIPQVSYGGGSGGSGGTNYTNPTANSSGKDWSWLQKDANQRFGLTNDAGIGQTYGGQHASDSLHYGGTAVDWGNAKNTPEQLQQAAAYYEQQPYASQVYYGSPGHEDHLHVGMK